MSKYMERRKGFSQGVEATARPYIVSDKHLEYLDALRESGVTNMLGARPWLMNAFEELGEGEASEVLGYWMKTFGKGKR